MVLFDVSANNPEDRQEINTVKPLPELITDQIPTLPLQFKLVLNACVSLLGQNEKNTKVALKDVFIEYGRLATEHNIDWITTGRLNELARELEMIGFLKCSYTRKREGRVMYIRFFDPSLIPKCATMLKEGLEKVRLEKDFGVGKPLKHPSAF